MIGATDRPTVVVTAGGSGIGRAIAEAFVAEKANVHICDVSEEAIENVISDNSGLKGTIADVSDPKAVVKLMNEARSWAGDIDILVNNAGIAGPTAPVEQIEIADWDKTMNVNLNGMFYCAREVIPAMKKNRRGCIINISTCSARLGMTGRTPYVASKVGVLGLNYNLARELGQNNIRVNAILPGTVDGERCRAMLADYASENNFNMEQAEVEFLRYCAMRTWIQPSEIADLAVFLASDKARHITGQEIAVDGLMEWEE